MVNATSEEGDPQMIRQILIAAIALLAWSTPAFAQKSANVAVGEPNGSGLPSDFRGRISYFGNHSGEVISTTTWRGGPKKDCPRPDHKCPERIGGSLEVELEYDGDIVKGTFRGTGGIRDSNLIGRRVGSNCRLYDLADGSVWSGRCDSYSFSGGVASVPNSQVQVSLKFDAVGTKTRDYTEWDRRRREAILRRRHYQMLQAQLKSDAPIETRFAAAVELDSYSWPFERLRPGSVSDIRRTKGKRDYFVTGSFRLEGGASGWARARVIDGDISCIELWDMEGVCRPLNLPGPPPEPEANPPADETSWVLPSTPQDPNRDQSGMTAVAMRQD
jgi:hypothetical protein